MTAANKLYEQVCSKCRKPDNNLQRCATCRASTCAACLEQVGGRMFICITMACSRLTSLCVYAGGGPRGGRPPVRRLYGYGRGGAQGGTPRALKRGKRGGTTGHPDGAHLLSECLMLSAVVCRQIAEMVLNAYGRVLVKTESEWDDTFKIREAISRDDVTTLTNLMATMRAQDINKV